MLKKKSTNLLRSNNFNDFNGLTYLKIVGRLVDEVDFSFEGSLTLTGAEERPVDRGLDCKIICTVSIYSDNN